MMTNSFGGPLELLFSENYLKVNFSTSFLAVSIENDTTRNFQKAVKPLYKKLRIENTLC